MKKLINHASTVVRDMLEGTVALSPGQRLLPDETVVIRADLPPPAQRLVAIISGGGSGHEPAHAGYVGTGMLSAAVAGDVFTSPSSDAVLAAIQSTAGKAGALLVVKNYTGDRLNFGLAAEMARAQGIAVETVVVADDVALRGTVEASRRRGIAGTVLVHKIAGALAAKGIALLELADIVRRTTADLGSMGVALGACTLPGVGWPGFELGADEIELGLGIHGEPGVQRGRMQRVELLVARILDTIVDDRGFTTDTRLALLVNGLGATPPMELAIAARDALRHLRDRGFEVERAWCGTLLSALDMPGFSLSLLRVDDERLALLDATTQAPAWPGNGRLGQRFVATTRKDVPAALQRAIEAPGVSPHGALQVAALAVATALRTHESRFTELDAQAGDGDLGASLSRGAQAIAALPSAEWSSPDKALTAMGHALRRAIAGSSGPFYATALLRAARHLADNTRPSPTEWSQAFSLAVQAVRELGGAQVGDRTMVDALQPAADGFAAAIGAGHPASTAWQEALAAARRGCDATAQMTPRLGRASYLGERALGIPDAGAVAVTVWIEALASHIR